MLLRMDGNITDLLSKALMKADFPTLAEPCKIKILVTSEPGSTGEIRSLMIKRKVKRKY